MSIRTAWIDAFSVFNANLNWNASGYDGYYIDREESCVDIGSAIAGATAPIDTTDCFKINKDTFNRLMNYYIEAGLMNSLGSEELFTETAKKQRVVIVYLRVNPIVLL